MSRWRDLFRTWWPAVKAVMAVAILIGVGWQFKKLLARPEIWEGNFRLRPAWVAASAGLYLVGLGFFAAFWVRLLRGLGERIGWLQAARAYFVGHLGKYVPGKAWAVILRTSLAGEGGVRVGVAALTATYETLTTMSSGALVAGVLFALGASTDGTMGWKALGLLALAGIPILPGVFNRLVRTTAAPFQGKDAPPLPQVRTSALLSGLVWTGCGWVVLGTSLWAMAQAILPEPLPLDAAQVVRCVAFLALAYVAGFLALPAPGGLGVREFILQQLLEPEFLPLLGPELAGPLSAVLVLQLRLVWTVAEVVVAGTLYMLPRSRVRDS